MEYGKISCVPVKSKETVKIFEMVNELLISYLSVENVPRPTGLQTKPN